MCFSMARNGPNPRLFLIVSLLSFVSLRSFPVAFLALFLFIDNGYICTYIYIHCIYGHAGCWARLFGRTLLSSSPRRKVVISWQRLDSTLSLNWMRAIRSACSWINSGNGFIRTRRPQFLSRSSFFLPFHGRLSVLRSIIPRKERSICIESAKNAISNRVDRSVPLLISWHSRTRYCRDMVSKYNFTLYFRWRVSSIEKK